MRLKLLFPLTFFISISLSLAATRIEKVQYDKLKDSKGILSINLKEDIFQLPKKTVKRNFYQYEFTDMITWPKIDKIINIHEKLKVTVNIYQYTPQITRLRIVFPFSVRPNDQLLNLKLRDKKVEVEFNINEILAKTNIKIGDVNRYDEKYLNELLSGSKKKKEVVKKKTGVSDIDADLFSENKVVDTKKAINNKGKKNPLQESFLVDNKKAESNFTMQIVKFVGLFILIMAIFFAIVSFIKKGIFGKRYSGMLKDKKNINVINRTFIEPKRSLMTIKVGEQVFLLSSTEKGVSLISELNDPVNLLKNVDEKLSGKNFDGNIQEQINNKDIENNIVLKEKIMSNESKINVKSSSITNKFKKKFEQLRTIS